MAKAAQSAEPSMEDILASIRRIISDESDAPAKSAPKAAPEPDFANEHMSEDDLDRLFAQSDETEAQAEDDAEVLDLGAMAASEPEEVLDLVEGLRPDEAELAFVEPEAPEPEPEPEPEPVRVAPKPAPRVEARRPDPVEEEPLVSETTGASVHSAFGQLTHTILAANAKTLDDLVKEMLRPMLKGWLDENLPAIVERLVRAEIERVSRGR
ncbi:PopZ family protein [Oryzibacter oryziterrae]|uniref:PopZ family protein n=1 Tax=Oryzibacter oryziterrae TaxID=2766474 RepID=UPI001F486100|nr:DUF2497 domain-containing protein [Oryzibacter oryziterrae]